MGVGMNLMIAKMAWQPKTCKNAIFAIFLLSKALSAERVRYEFVRRIANNRDVANIFLDLKNRIVFENFEPSGT